MRKQTRLEMCGNRSQLENVARNITSVVSIDFAQQSSSRHSHLYLSRAYSVLPGVLRLCMLY
jgi:hypothetical protein